MPCQPVALLGRNAHAHTFARTLTQTRRVHRRPWWYVADTQSCNPLQCAKKNPSVHGVDRHNRLNKENGPSLVQPE
ncbi:hypothetical protein QQF64_019913 [Cirrhinus molitorella]|uniref:Uncharacterized protein n=1 Tax=Cirrhinus molitorella TaxID=172907 RepID=A0ABR3LKG3_9TELE